MTIEWLEASSTRASGRRIRCRDDIAFVHLISIRASPERLGNRMEVLLRQSRSADAVKPVNDRSI